MSARIPLPFPPSVNAIWRSIVIKGAPRVLLSTVGREYRARVASLLARHGAPATGALRVTIDAYPPDRRRRDVDNLAKATLDALTHAGVWGDDSQVIDLRIRLHPASPIPGLIVEVESIAPAAPAQPSLIAPEPDLATELLG
jgi:crossover junction endodeoxyribonuclease RusA